MISNRCTGFNLMNHWKQTDTLKHLDIVYSYDKTKYRNEWECVITFKHKDMNHSYKKSGYKKRNILLDIINEIDPHIF